MEEAAIEERRPTPRTGDEANEQGNTEEFVSEDEFPQMPFWMSIAL
jgi:hypothetical protein